MTGRTVVVSLLAVALLAWFLRSVNLTDVWSHVRSARGDYLALGFGFVTMPYWMRALRWQCLLEPVGPTRFRVAFRTTVIGFAALALLPARVGDVLRPYLLARQEGLSLPATFATVVMERVLDLVAVLTLLALFVWGADTSALAPSLMGPVKAAASTAGAAAVALLVVMWILATHPERVGGMVRFSNRVLPHALADRLAHIAATFSSGFAAAREPRGFAKAVLWSFPIWIAFAGESWAVTRAFGIDMPFAGTFLLQAMLVIGVAIPTPGGVGGFHEMYRMGVTSFFGAGNEAAVAAAIVLHVMSFVPVTIVGLMFMAQDGLSLGRLQELAGAAREREA
jgi:glycosyltransferase 2 family protein